MNCIHKTLHYRLILYTKIEKKLKQIEKNVVRITAQRNAKIRVGKCHWGLKIYWWNVPWKCGYFQGGAVFSCVYNFLALKHFQNWSCGLYSLHVQILSKQTFYFFISFWCSAIRSFTCRPVSPTYLASQSLQSIR